MGAEPIDPGQGRPAQPDLSALDPAMLRALADLVEHARRADAAAAAEGDHDPAAPGLLQRVQRAGAAGAGAVAGAIGGAVGAVGQGAAQVAQGIKARADKVVARTYEKALLCRLTLSMHETLSLLAAREGVSMNRLVNEALEDLLTKKGYALPAPRD